MSEFYIQQPPFFLFFVDITFLFYAYVHLLYFLDIMFLF